MFITKRKLRKAIKEMERRRNHLRDIAKNPGKHGLPTGESHKLKEAELIGAVEAITVVSCALNRLL